MKTSPFAKFTESLLESMLEMDPREFGPTATAWLLWTIGDATRLTLGVRGVGRHVAALTQAQVLGAINELTEMVLSWNTPFLQVEDHDGHCDPYVETAIKQRDQIESALTGARRVMLPRGVLIDCSEECARLRAALAQVDFSHVPRDLAWSILEERHELFEESESSWLRETRWLDSV